MQLTLSHASFGLLLLLSVSVQAKESDYQQPVVVDSVTQQAELNENKVTFLQDVVITQGSIIIHADKVVVLR
ncbi:MAG: LptA/OstA family protein, partial [Tolumonas sp.]